MTSQQLSLSDIEAGVFTLTSQLLHELGNHHALQNMALSAAIDKDLGIGSLERAELLTRLNNAFDVQLSQQSIFQATTLEDLVRLVQQINPRTISKQLLSANSTLPAEFTPETSIPDDQSYESPTEHTRRLIHIVANYLYVGYFYVMLVLSLLLVWLIVLPLPARYHRFIAACAHCWGYTFLTLVGCRPHVTGLQHLAANNTPMIFVANHASFIDVSVLLAALPIELIFVAKQELLRIPVVGTFLKKQQQITVNRRNGAEDAGGIHQIEQHLRLGRSVLIFPEGTFTETRGVRPFKLGAFKVAIETALPICPIAISGTRQMLPSNTRLPRRHPLTVTVLEPLLPVSKQWSEIIRLRDAARHTIARHCHEPLLKLVAAGVET